MSTPSLYRNDAREAEDEDLTILGYTVPPRPKNTAGILHSENVHCTLSAGKIVKTTAQLSRDAISVDNVHRMLPTGNFNGICSGEFEHGAGAEWTTHKYGNRPPVQPDRQSHLQKRAGKISRSGTRPNTGKILKKLGQREPRTTKQWGTADPGGNILVSQRAIP